MAKILTAHDLEGLRGQRKVWGYNGMDSIILHPIMDRIGPRITPVMRATYNFEMATQAPAMAMMRRAVRVDIPARGRAVAGCKRDLKTLMRKLTALPLVKGVWDGTTLETGTCPKGDGKQRHQWPKGEPDATRKCKQCGSARTQPEPLNPNSPPQCWHFFYDLHDIPVQKNKKHEESTDDEVLERIGAKWPQFFTITETMRSGRGLKKQIGFLNGRLTASGRYASSFNVGGADTGRFSSSKSPFWIGGNLQNIAEKNRHIFIADPGREMFYADLEQAESRVVAYVANDQAYIDAHNSGDVHTYISRLLWPELPWTGDMVRDRKIAEQPSPFDPDHSYRYNGKRCGHGLNYRLSAGGLAKWAHIPYDVAKLVYDRYWDTFHQVYHWQGEVAETVKTIGAITTPLGRHRFFFGRRDDPHTARQAIAFIPQSMVADILNAALWWVWKDMDVPVGAGAPVQLLAQVHDAILGQIWKGDDAALSGVLKRMLLPVKIGARTMTIPVEMMRGRNWKKADEGNPDGLRKWQP